MFLVCIMVTLRDEKSNMKYKTLSDKDGLLGSLVVPVLGACNVMVFNNN